MTEVKPSPAKWEVVGMKRICILFFFALVLGAPFAGHACGDTLTLPPGVKAVQEETFYQDALGIPTFR